MPPTAFARPAARAGSGAGRTGQIRPLSGPIVKLLTATSLAGLVAGCAGVDAGRDGTGWVAPGEESLALLGDIRPDRWRAARYADGWQTEEYGDATSGTLRLEYVDAAVDLDGGPVALASSFDVRRAVALFRHNQAGPTAWGAAGRVEKPGGTLFYQPYRLDGEACFGFEGDLDRVGGDPLGRPGEVLLGYGCSAAGGPLPPERIETLLAGVGLRGATTPARTPSPPPARAALEFARGDGGSGPGRGVTAFPLPLAQHYTLADADEAW